MINYYSNLKKHGGLDYPFTSVLPDCKGHVKHYKGRQGTTCYMMQALAHSLGCGMENKFHAQWCSWRYRAAVVINNAEQSCGEHGVSVALPRALHEGQWHHCFVPGVWRAHRCLLTSSYNQVCPALGTKDVCCHIWAQKALWMLWRPAPPIATGLYMYDTQQIYGGRAYGTGSPKRRAERHIYIHCREAKCAKFWFLTCTENSENAIITALCTILPEDATMAICTSSGKLVIILTWPEDKLLTKEKQNEKKPHNVNITNTYEPD